MSPGFGFCWVLQAQEGKVETQPAVAVGAVDHSGSKMFIILLVFLPPRILPFLTLDD